MIRFLQTDNRLVKALLVVIIGAAAVSMVVYLIPGLTGRLRHCRRHLRRGLPALVQPLSSSGETVSQQRVEQVPSSSWRSAVRSTPTIRSS